MYGFVAFYLVNPSGFETRLIVYVFSDGNDEVVIPKTHLESVECLNKNGVYKPSGSGSGSTKGDTIYVDEDDGSNDRFNNGKKTSGKKGNSKK